MNGVRVKMGSVDKKSVLGIMSNADSDSDYIQSLTDELVNSCCDKLDKYIDYVSNQMNDPDYELTPKQLDDIVMTIPTMLYYVGTQQERFGIKRDVSKTSRDLLYNKIYQDTSGTAGVKKSTAESQLFNEDMVVLVYKSAYETIKAKVSFAMEILQSAKKIISRRMAESELSNVTPSREIFK